MPVMFQSLQIYITTNAGTLHHHWIDAVTDALDGIVPSVSSNFFTVGGDSLSAATVASSLSKHVGAEVRIASIMRYPTARAWAEAWQRERNASTDTKDP